MSNYLLTVSGSARKNATNTALLKSFSGFFPQKNFFHFEQLTTLPLYTVAADENPLPVIVTAWRKAVAESSGIIISTPEYIHNIPAVLKNALEWLTTSGELSAKSVLAITYLPNAPRGEKAMESLTWSLKALDSRVVAVLPLYQTEIEVADGVLTGKEEVLEFLREAVELL